MVSGERETGNSKDFGKGENPKKRKHVRQLTLHWFSHKKSVVIICDEPKASFASYLRGKKYRGQLPLTAQGYVKAESSPHPFHMLTFPSVSHILAVQCYTWVIYALPSPLIVRLRVTAALVTLPTFFLCSSAPHTLPSCLLHHSTHGYALLLTTFRCFSPKRRESLA